MSINVTADDLYPPSGIKLFAITYVILGILLMIFSIIYFILTIKTTCEEKDAGHGHFGAQVSYIVALFVKCLGLIISGIFLLTHPPTSEDHSFNDKYSVLPGGIPGYTTAIAYCFIFFSWCSVCYDYLEKGSTGFYDKSRGILITLISIIVLLFSISFICMIAINPKTFHRVEQGVAITRDLILAIMFTLYLVKIYKLFEECCPGFHSPETKLFVLCSLLIFSLIMRPIGIAIYSLYTNPPGNLKHRSEFNTAYFFIFLIEFILTELIPLLAIGLTRLIGTNKRTTIPEDVSTFIAIV